MGRPPFHTVLAKIVMIMGYYNYSAIPPSDLSYIVGKAHRKSHCHTASSGGLSNIFNCISFDTSAHCILIKEIFAYSADI